MKLLPIILICSLSFWGCSGNDNQQHHEKSQADIDKEAEQYRQKVEAQRQELANEDKPHFDWPRVDYTTPVAKVDLTDDQAILNAINKPVLEEEKVSNQNGEPATIYYFSQDLINGLDVSLSREFIEVNWRFNAKEPEKATATFEDGLRISRALLGGKDGAALYENISKGAKINQLILENGTVIKNARCSSSICRYTVVR